MDCRHVAIRRLWARHCMVMVSTALVSLPAMAQSPEQLLDSAISEQAGIDARSRQSQLRIAQLDEETSEYFADFRVAVQQLDSTRIYNGNLERLVADQEDEKQSINRQLDDFGDVERGIVPLMFEMIANLKSFIELDMPFSQNERRDRIDRLAHNMDRSDLTVSEKYRQIMEAYQIETSYGRNIEAYPGTLEIEGVDRKVDMLRVGRILLAYQTPDQSETGFWNKTTQEWAPLDGSYRRAVRDAIRIARKQATPALLELPVPAAEPLP